MTNHVLRKSVYFNVPPAKVWAFLTELDKLNLWFHAPTKPMREGEKYEMIGADSGKKFMWGEALTVRPPEVLEYTFVLDNMENTTSTVRWTLSFAGDGGTHLQLEHTGLATEGDAFGLFIALDNGWDEHLMRLRTHAMKND